MRSSDIHRALREEPLLLCIKSSQLRWFRHPDVSLAMCFRHVQSRGDPEADPGYAWDCLGLLHEELAELAREKVAWATLLRPIII